MHSESTEIVFSGLLGPSDTEKIRSRIEAVAPTRDHLVLDFSDCRNVDSTVLAAVYDSLRRIEGRGVKVEVRGLSPEDRALFRSFKRYEPGSGTMVRGWNLHDHFVGVGEDVFSVWRIILGLRRFSRETFAAFWRSVRHPASFRWQLSLYYMEEAGVKAVPIVGVLCWLLGTVLGFQAAYQLKTFAAEAYMPDMVAYSMTWEVGPLLAAILVAGRSSAAFAAEIGTMKVRQEVDALEVMGFSIFEYLVTPKMVALILVMPFLVLIADFFGLLGGLLIGAWYIDMPASYYISRLSTIMMPIDFFWGMLKGIVFAVIIANVGCYSGIRVRGGASEVGRATTTAVVIAIFLVIVADALFSLMFVQIRPTVVA